MTTQAEVDKAFQDAVDETTEITNTIDAAVVALNTFPAQMQKLLDDYKAANPTVTDAQVSGLQGGITTQKAYVAKLAAAIPANVEPAPPAG